MFSCPVVTCAAIDRQYCFVVLVSRNDFGEFWIYFHYLSLSHLKSDDGKEFCNKLVSNVLKRGTDITIACNHHSNDVVESQQGC